MKPDSSHTGDSRTDVLNIAGDPIPEIDAVLAELLERGKSERVMILSGTEADENRRRKPYAATKVEIAFKDEASLRTCVRLLRWSDDRLRARPDQVFLWEWTRSFRDRMTIHFGVNWYDKDFFEKRKNAFMEPRHASYYAFFGARPEDFKMVHTSLG